MENQAIGRCPECGAAVTVTIVEGQPGEVSPHACGSRACEHPSCTVRRDLAEMEPFTVKAGGADDSRESLYTRMEGE